MLNLMAISEFWSGDFTKISVKLRISLKTLNSGVGGDHGALQFFGHLKRPLELFISVIMSPLTTF